jgi:hypothetical protein
MILSYGDAVLQPLRTGALPTMVFSLHRAHRRAERGLNDTG